jgi:hypothetical protein
MQRTGAKGSHSGRVGADRQTAAALRGKNVSPSQQQTRQVYNDAVFEFKKEIPA